MSAQLSAILVEEHTRPLVYVSLVLEAGCLNDPAGKEGLAWLTGQMLTRGAGDLSQHQLAEELELLGARLSVNVGRETASISGDVLTRNLAAFEDLAAKVVGAPRFEASELEKLRRQTLAEIAQVTENDPSLGQRHYVLTMFRGHPYGRPLLGTPESVASITLDDIKAFYDRYYVRTPRLVAAAGDVTRPRVDEYAARVLSTRPERDRVALSVPGRELPEGRRTILVDKPDRSQTQVFVGHPVVDANHPDFMALHVGNTVFGGTFTATLSHEIREKRGWSYGAYSYVGADRCLGTFTMRFYPGVPDTVPALALSDQLLRTLVTDGIDEERVEFARRYLTNSHPFSVDTAVRRLQELSSARLLGRPEGWVDTYVDLVNAVDAAHVSRALKAHIHPDRALTVVVGTASQLEAPLRDWDRVGELEVVDYRAFRI